MDFHGNKLQDCPSIQDDKLRNQSLPILSVVIPVFNEVEGLPQCIERVYAVLAASKLPFEIIFVDDGSVDNSRQLEEAAAQKYPEVVSLFLRRNVGQQKALLAALRYSQGKVVITYDADLQFDPECLPVLTEKILSGYDIAGGIRVTRQDPWLWNRLPSWLGNLLINRALGIKQEDFGAVKAYSRKLVDEIQAMPTEYLIIPAAAYSLSKNFIEIPIKHEPRKTGQSAWTVFKRLETYLDIYVSYAKRPFEWVMLSGVLCLSLSFVLGIGIIGYWFIVSRNFAGTIIFFDVFLGTMGVHFLILSMIGEFVVRTYRRRLEVKPIVSEMHGRSTRDLL